MRKGLGTDLMTSEAAFWAYLLKEQPESGVPLKLIFGS